MPRQRTRADVVSCSELMPMNHSTQLPHSAEDTRGISASRCIILPLQDFFLYISLLRAQAFSSGKSSQGKSRQSTKVECNSCFCTSTRLHSIDSHLLQWYIFVPKDILLNILFRKPYLFFLYPFSLLIPARLKQTMGI